ncbi:MAG: Two component regulator three Y domain protein, partial [Kosmotogaceae bacterium]
YNQIVMGFGTGLMPPSSEEWTIIGNQWSLSGDFVEGSSLPLSFDNSSSIFFPPIGDQGSEGSCVAFSQGYYTATFYEARDNGWNMTNADWSGGAPTSSFLNKIMSPDFVYHLINDGVDKGSSYVDAQNVIGSIGISSWAEMPYNVSDYTSWPDEDAWREAPKYRNGSAQNNLVIRVENDADIQTLKSYLASGWLVSISIDANRYTSLSVNDVWNSSNYTVVSTNHANTIVGYDDNRPGE